MPPRNTAPDNSTTYVLTQDKDCKGSVRYRDQDGINFYAPKPVCGLDEAPERITLTVSPTKAS